MSNVVDIIHAAAKRDAKKYRFTPKSATEIRENEARKELVLWVEKHKDLGSHFLAEQGTGLLMMADMLQLDR
jgi:hypothetical protein